MKAFLLSLFLLMNSAFAGTIKSMSECTVNLYKSNPFTKLYKLEGSRISGEAAVYQAETLRANGVVEDVFDVLGVKRYIKAEKQTVLNAFGSDINSCDGVYFALQVDTCTVDANEQVCETFCKLNWRGIDCR